MKFSIFGKDEKTGLNKIYLENLGKITVSYPSNFNIN